MANESMHMSNPGMAALRQREGAVFRYYNDAAKNCTYGVGTLAHLGPCSSDELRRPVSIADVNIQLATRVRSAEAVVRQQVRNHQLTQEQFDALVSFTYNTGATGSGDTLDSANRGAFRDVATHMSNNIYVHPRDARGRRLAPVRLLGLVARRREEAAPFLAQKAGR